MKRLLIGLLSLTRTLAAQPPDHASSAVLLDHRDLALLAGATAASALLTKWDKPIARAFSDSALHARHPGFTKAALRTSLVTETVLMAAGGATYFVAHRTNNGSLAEIAFHTTEGVAGAAMFIQVIRGALGRGRPYVVDDSGEVRDADPYEFNFLKGFTSFNYRSWPSMHAMASYAAAAGLATEMRYRDTPNRHLWSGLLYVVASGPSFARMYLDEHWASDISMGVFIGIFAGQKAVSYAHEHPDNHIDQTFLGPQVRATITRDASGFSFSLSPF